MIEINLIPDVKQEFIRAKRVRAIVVSGSIFVGIVSVAITVLLGAYLGVQLIRSNAADAAITANEKKLKDVPDLANMLTIQSQLANITAFHDNENISSRIFDLLTTINPASPNKVSFSMVRFDAESNLIHIDCQAQNGFVAADVFKKTIQAATFSYQDGGETLTPLLAKDISVSDLSYGEDVTGAKVLRFSVDFTYDPALFAATSKNVKVIGPNRQNATDSYKYLPESIFSSRAADLGSAK